jgi:nitrogen fixation/metabolism regulation signal transduction histidine kinase
MTAQNPAAAGPPVKYKRNFRNYLLDTKFQLKWTGRIIIVALGISALMGAFLWQTSKKVTEQTEIVIAEGEKAIEQNRVNSELLQMKMLDEAKDSPELLTVYQAKAKKEADGLKKQKEDLEAQAAATRAQQGRMGITIVAALLLLVVLIGILGIFFTHKVVGPIHMMKILLRQVGDGKLNFNRKPRKGDELIEFFEVFQDMVNKLKDRQAEEVKVLEQAMEEAKASGASDAAIEKIKRVRDQMHGELAK